MIRNVTLTAYFLISEFPGKLLTHFTKISSLIVELTKTWFNTIEIIRVAAITKL